MSMAADRQYLAVSRHIAALKQGEIVHPNLRLKSRVRRANQMHECLRVNS
jgi:hypothetical protein